MPRSRLKHLFLGVSAMKKSCLTLLASMVMVLLPVSLEAQWARAYGGKGNDEAACVQPTPDGGFIVVGTNAACGIWVAKLGSSGKVIWQRTTADAGGEWLSGAFVQTTRDNGFVLTGRASWGMPRMGLLAWKLDANGNTRWQKYLIDPDQQHNTAQEGSAVQPTSDGGHVFVGTQQYWNPQMESRSKEDLLVFKTDSLGNIKWRVAAGGLDTDLGRSVQETPEGGFIVAGSTKSMGAGDHDYYVMKLKSNGGSDWDFAYGGPGEDQAREVRRTADGGYIVVGSTKSFGAGDYDVWLLKLGGKGKIVWQKTYGGAKADYGNSVYPASDGGLIVAGTTSSFGSGGFDAWVLKLDARGNVQWEKAYGGASHESLFSVRPLAGGGYVAAGRTRSFGVNAFDVLVLKLGQTGKIDPSCGTFVRATRAEVGKTSGTSVEDPGAGWPGQGLWVTVTFSLSDPRAANTVICKK
jgi:hypothetical protein